MSQKGTEDLNSICSGSGTCNSYTSLHLLQSLFNSERLDQYERISRCNELSAQMEQKLVQDEEAIDGFLDRLTDIKRSIKELQSSINNLKVRRNSLKSELQETTNKNESDTANGADFTNEYCSVNLTQLTETTKQFERLFGIKLKRTTGDTLQIIFRGCSGPSAPDIVCSCQLRYNRVGRFDGCSCNPPVPDFERLINYLNMTMDLRSFLIILRRRFCRYFELAAAVSNKVN